MVEVLFPKIYSSALLPEQARALFQDSYLMGPHTLEWLPQNFLRFLQCLVERPVVSHVFPRPRQDVIQILSIRTLWVLGLVIQEDQTASLVLSFTMRLFSPPVRKELVSCNFLVPNRALSLAVRSVADVGGGCAGREKEIIFSSNQSLVLAVKLFVHDKLVILWNYAHFMLTTNLSYIV